MVFRVFFHIFPPQTGNKQGQIVYQRPSITGLSKHFHAKDLARRLFAWMKAKQLGAGQLIFMLG